MSNERRIAEASSLRELFREQWSSLSSLLGERNVRQMEEQQRELVVDAAIDNVVTKTDARIRAIGSYKKSLRQSVHAILEHVEGLVASLPPAQQINQQTFVTAKNINRFFVSAGEMQEIFSRSYELQQYFADHGAEGQEEAYCLLSMYKQEKNVLGMGVENNLLVRDQRKTNINFLGHKVTASSVDECELRSALKRILFDRIAAFIRSELSGELGLAKQHPQLSLDRLCKAMSKPRKLIGIEHNSLQVDRLGTLQVEESVDEDNIIQLDEIKIAELPREIILLARYPRSEMLSLDELRQRSEQYLG